MSDGRPAWSWERDALIIDRYLAGDSLRVIARDFGISFGRVRQLLARHGNLKRESFEARMRRPSRWATCRQCGGQFSGQPRYVARRRFCSRRCSGIASRLDGPGEYKGTRHKDGHWWVTDPETGNGLRAERYLIQQHLGRKLRRDEWVILKDGNPDNLSIDNIAIVTAREANARRVYTKPRGRRRRAT